MKRKPAYLCYEPATGRKEVFDTKTELCKKKNINYDALNYDLNKRGEHIHMTRRYMVEVVWSFVKV